MDGIEPMGCEAFGQALTHRARHTHDAPRQNLIQLLGCQPSIIVHNTHSSYRIPAASLPYRILFLS